MSKINVKNFIKENLDLNCDEPFYVFNVEDVIDKHQKWLELLPRVTPYYAVKANRLPFLLEIMIGLGLKFDCASQVGYLSQIEPQISCFLSSMKWKKF